MISTHNIDPGCCLHPSARGILFVIPAATPAALAAAQAESAAVVGTPLTLVAGAAGAGPAGYITGTPICVAITIAGAVHGSTYRIIGINQFGKQVTEDIAPTAIGVTWTNHAYKQIISVTPLTVVSSASTIALGYVLTSGVKIGLPFRPSNSTQAGATVASFQTKLEIVGYFNAAAVAFSPLATPAINERYATLQFSGTIVQGAGLLITNYINKGFREK
jgi:hypothetical protein